MRRTHEDRLSWVARAASRAAVLALGLGAAGCQYLIGLENTKLHPDASPVIPGMEASIDAVPDAPPPPIRVGTGADGALMVSGVAYTDGVRTALAMPVLAQSTGLHVTGTTGFSIGDEILIVQMTGPNAGQHETVTVQSILSTQLLVTPLLHSYEAKTQIVRVPNYTNVTVASGGTLTAHAWDGATGGIVFFRASIALVVEQGGTLTASSLGFDGGTGGDGGIGGAGATGGNGGTRALCPTAGCSLAPGATGGPGDDGTVMLGAAGGSGTQRGTHCTGGAGGRGGVHGLDGQAGVAGSAGEGPGAGAASSAGGTNGTADALRPMLGGGGAGGDGGPGGRGGGGGGGGGGPVAGTTPGTNGGIKGGTGDSGGRGGNGGRGGRGGGLVMVSAMSVDLAGALSASGAAGTAGELGMDGGAGGDGGIGGNNPTTCSGGQIYGGQGGGGGGANGGQGGNGSGGGGGGTIRIDAYAITAGGSSHAIGGSTTAPGGGGAGGQGGTGPGGQAATAGAQGPTGTGGNAGSDGRFYLRYVDSCTSCSTVGVPAAVVQKL